MMLEDVVVDTNVLAHAQNPYEARFADAVRFVKELLGSGCETELCVDPGFGVTDANRSLIGHEYRQVLRQGSPAYEAVTRMFLGGRVREVTRKIPPQMRRKVNQCVATSRDQTFVIVAMNSTDRVLTSHDFKGGFQPSRRPIIQRELKVDVVDAATCWPRLA